MQGREAKLQQRPPRPARAEPKGLLGFGTQNGWNYSLGAYFRLPHLEDFDVLKIARCRI